MNTPTPEVQRNGLATKLGVGGASGALAIAIVDAIVTGHIDSDATRAALAAVILAGLTMLLKGAQAVAGILANRLPAAAPVTGYLEHAVAGIDENKLAVTVVDELLPYIDKRLEVVHNRLDAAVQAASRAPSPPSPVDTAAAAAAAAPPAARRSHGKRQG